MVLLLKSFLLIQFGGIRHFSFDFNGRTICFFSIMDPFLATVYLFLLLVYQL